MEYRVLPPQLELMDSQCLCILQLLDILHLLFVAPELLCDQDLYTPGKTQIIIHLLKTVYSASNTHS